MGDSEIQLGETYIDCRYHPMVCVKLDPHDPDGVTGLDLATMETSNCSISHCVVAIDLPTELLKKLKYLVESNSVPVVDDHMRVVNHDNPEWLDFVDNMNKELAHG